MWSSPQIEYLNVIGAQRPRLKIPESDDWNEQSWKPPQKIHAISILLFIVTLL
jgi:hypothetical protein